MLLGTVDISNIDIGHLDSFGDRMALAKVIGGRAHKRDGRWMMTGGVQDSVPLDHPTVLRLVGKLEAEPDTPIRYEPDERATFEPDEEYHPHSNTWAWAERLPEGLMDYVFSLMNERACQAEATIPAGMDAQTARDLRAQFDLLESGQTLNVSRAFNSAHVHLSLLHDVFTRRLIVSAHRVYPQAPQPADAEPATEPAYADALRSFFPQVDIARILGIISDYQAQEQTFESVGDFAGVLTLVGQRHGEGLMVICWDHEVQEMPFNGQPMCDIVMSLSDTEKPVKSGSQSVRVGRDTWYVSVNGSEVNIESPQGKRYAGKADKRGALSCGTDLGKAGLPVRVAVMEIVLGVAV